MSDQNKKQNWGDMSGTSDEEDEQEKVNEEQKQENKQQDNEGEEEIERPKFSYNKTGQQQQERKKLPNKYEMIDEIKQQDSNEVVLSIFNVHYNADAKTIQEAFHEFNFKRIHNYRKGMFALYFSERQEAIKFIKASPRPLLGRNFIVKISEKNTKKKEEEFTQIGFGNKPLHYQERGSKKQYDSKPRYPNNNFNRKINSDDVIEPQTQGAFFKRDTQEDIEANAENQGGQEQTQFKRNSNQGYKNEGGYKKNHRQSGDQLEEDKDAPNVGFFKGDRKEKRSSEIQEKSNPFGKAKAIDDKSIQSNLVVLKKRESETLQEQAKTDDKQEKPVAAKQTPVVKKVEEKVEKVEKVKEVYETVQSIKRDSEKKEYNKKQRDDQKYNNEKRDSQNQKRDQESRRGNRDNKDRDDKREYKKENNERRGNRKQDNEKKQEKQEKQEDDDWKVAGQKSKPAVDDEWQVVGQKQKKDKRSSRGERGQRGEDKQRGNNYDALE